MGTRRALAVGCAAVLLLLAGLAWHLHGRSDARRAAQEPAPESAEHSTPPVSARSAISNSQSGSAAPVPASETAVAIDPRTAPPLDAPHSKEAPPQKGFTREETIAKREADLKLLDDTKKRLEQDLDAARNAHDTVAISDLEVRIERLSDTRKKRVDELEKIRAGGELPQ